MMLDEYLTTFKKHSQKRLHNIQGNEKKKKLHHEGTRRRNPRRIQMGPRFSTLKEEINLQPIEVEKPKVYNEVKP